MFSTILATEYEAEPAFVITAVFATTLLSPLTLTPLLLVLGAYSYSLRSSNRAIKGFVVKARL